MVFIKVVAGNVEQHRNIYIHVYIHIHDMTKVISISDDVYGDLMKIKGDHESFSQFFRKFAAHEKKKPLLSFFGKWPGKKGELDEIKLKLEKERKVFKTRNASFD